MTPLESHSNVIDIQTKMKMLCPCQSQLWLLLYLEKQDSLVNGLGLDSQLNKTQFQKVHRLATLSKMVKPNPLMNNLCLMAQVTSPPSWRLAFQLWDRSDSQSAV